jgi:DNA polymerase-3 subunit epsilon
MRIKATLDNNDENMFDETLKTYIDKNKITMQQGKSMIIFDTETTGLKPGNIVQLAYLLITDKDIKAKNFFFKVDYVEPGAELIHGFSVERLKKLSNNKEFGFYANQIHKDFTKADILVAHNIQFDMNFLKKELRSQNLDIDPDNQFCTMRHFTNILELPRTWGRGYKWPKLSELTEFLKIDKNEKIKLSEYLFGEQNQPHDARGDIVDTYLALKKGIEKGYIFKNELEIKSIKTLNKEINSKLYFPQSNTKNRANEMVM